MGIITKADSGNQLLYLLQLASPALPVGAYSYSEGLEMLVVNGFITNAPQLQTWIRQELTYGAIQVEASVLVNAYRCTVQQDWDSLSRWNRWLSAFRETEELREQSWQMGRSLIRLLSDLEPSMQTAIQAGGTPCNFAIAFAIAAAGWQIDETSTILAYLHSWTTNLIGAGVKLIPLGQTIGQQTLINLHPAIQQAADNALQPAGSALESCGWGLAIASMTHETLYSRLFRS